VPSFRRLSAAGASALSIWELAAPQSTIQELLGLKTPLVVDKMLLLRKNLDFDQALCWCRRLPISEGDAIVELHLHGGFGVAASLRSLLLAADWKEESGFGTENKDLLFASSPLAARIFAAREGDAWGRCIQHLAGSAEKVRQAEAVSMQRWNHWGGILAQPPTLLLAGPPNAGKSTLFNSWLKEQRVTASAAAGTTRDLVSAPLLLGEGAEAFRVNLTDSAGVWEQAVGVDADAVAMSRLAISSAWRVIWMLDAVAPPSDQLLEQVLARPKHDILVVNRCDLPAAWDPQEVLPRDFTSTEPSQHADLPALLTGEILAQLGPVPPSGQLLAINQAEREELEALTARDSRQQP